MSASITSDIAYFVGSQTAAALRAGQKDSIQGDDRADFDRAVGALKVVTSAALLFAVGMPLLLGSVCDRQNAPPAGALAGRSMDKDARFAYVANLGEATAFDISVTSSGEVISAVPIVPAYGPDRLSSSSTQQCNLNLFIRERFGNDVVVQIKWRFDDREWFTQTVRAI
jgi:hypothetical protein